MSSRPLQARLQQIRPPPPRCREQSPLQCATGRSGSSLAPRRVQRSRCLIT